jgi:hypothetical protein
MNTQTQTARQLLKFVAVTSGGQGFDIAFPLHPETRSAEAVSDLITDLLATISRHASGASDLSSGDILQALAMTLAIRGRMLDADMSTIETLIGQLNGAAWQAVNTAEPFATGRA